MTKFSVNNIHTELGHYVISWRGHTRRICTY